MLKSIGVATATLFIMTASPVAAFNDCFDGCVLNCVRLGQNYWVCAAECMETVCPNVAPMQPKFDS